MNILFILTDDQPPQTMRPGILGADAVDLTPTGYSDVPLCGPARVGLWSGLYPHNHGATLNTNAYGRYREGGFPQRDLYQRMNAAGYRVGHIGKVINGYGDKGNDHWVHPYVDRWVGLASGQGQGDYEVNIDGTIRAETQNQTNYFFDKAEAFVRSADSRPWLCFLAITDPHGPYTPMSAFQRSHDNEVFSSPGTEDDPSDMSEWTRTEAAHGTPQEVQDSWEGAIEELEGVYSRVSKMLALLSETGQLENTLVIYTSDNGYMMGEHGGLFRKALPYEESARVPFALRGPEGSLEGLSPGMLVNRLDLTATMLEAAGARWRDLDGRSLLGAGPATPRRRRMLVEHPGLGWRLVREGDAIYVELPSGETELYDLSADPYEEHNLVGQRPEQESALSGWLERLSGATGDALRALEESPG